MPTTMEKLEKPKKTKTYRKPDYAAAMEKTSSSTTKSRSKRNLRSIDDLHLNIPILDQPIDITELKEESDGPEQVLSCKQKNDENPYLSNDSLSTLLSERKAFLKSMGIALDSSLPTTETFKHDSNGKPNTRMTGKDSPSFIESTQQSRALTNQELKKDIAQAAHQVFLEFLPVMQTEIMKRVIKQRS